MNTTLAAALGTILVLLAKIWLTEQKAREAMCTLTDALMGCLSSLVSITDGCAYIESWASIFIGLILGILYFAGSHLTI